MQLFKQLRNKFLILNLVIISVMMLLSFTAIYLITYNNVQRNIDAELRKISEPNRRPNENPKDSKPIFDNSSPPHGRSVSFALVTDNKGNIIDSISLFDMDQDFYESAKKEALSKNSNTGKFKLDGNHWVFITKPYMSENRIVFLDITYQQSILTNLIYTFLAVAFAMLIVIFFISRFFANRSIEPIKEAFDRQKQFIADASHELKTPLAVINTNVDVLLSNGEHSVSSQSKWLHYIKSEVERMAKLTKNLLYLTQIDYSEINMVYSQLNLSEAVESIILTMEAIIFENNILLNYDIEPNLVVSGNSEQLKQVVMILLDNALKYTNINGRVNLFLKKSYNNVVLSVTNTGNGIPDKYIHKIFDRFYRIDKSRSRDSGGYGLGLAIAKAIVEQHGGKIETHSVLNESTTFNIELPRIS
jgi:two-component system, OmpR family, sensor histidine kinase CiaH